jgi:hypothetical protein
MSLTVTASQGGTGTDDGIILTVKVLTGALAAAAQNGTQDASTSITTPQLAITPTATGSWVYGAVTNVAAATAFTANGSTTFSQNVLYAGDGDTFGTFRSTGTTTAATPVTVGASAPAETTGNLIWAAAEILAATTLAEDPSSPAGKNTTTATTISTASFSPPGGSLLVAVVSNNGTGSGTLTVTVSDTLDLTWTQLANTTYDRASVWVAQVPASPAVQVPLQAVKARTPAAFRAGRTYKSASSVPHTITSGPAFRPMVQAVRAKLPQQPLLRGRTEISQSSPVKNPTKGPAFQQKTSPARIRPSLPPRGHLGSNKGSAPRNPTKGPAFRQATRPAQAKRPWRRPSGGSVSFTPPPYMTPPGPVPPPPTPVVTSEFVSGTPGLMQPGTIRPGIPYDADLSPVVYEYWTYIGHVPVYYLDYLDLVSRGTLYAVPGNSYAIWVANTRLGLTIPPDDGRWLGGPPGLGDEVPLHRRVFLKLREHIHKSRRRSGYRNPPGGMP